MVEKLKETESRLAELQLRAGNRCKPPGEEGSDITDEIKMINLQKEAAVLRAKERARSAEVEAQAVLLAELESRLKASSSKLRERETFWNRKYAELCQRVQPSQNGQS